jgi:exodeoxyribonuclease VII large subunit
VQQAAGQDPLFETTLSPTEVGLAVERALTRQFPGDIWIRGEIRNKSRSNAGHVYFDLCDDTTTLRVTLWNSDRLAVNHALSRVGNAVRIDDGAEVRIRCNVTFWSRQGRVSLRMLAIDPAFTLGQLAADRERLLALLRSEGLLRAQAALPLPLVPRRIGVVTSLGSAAHADVRRTLEAAGIGWHIVECDARVQGVDAPASIAASLRAVAAAGVDVVCLVRGGGARTELAAFDRESVARAVAGLTVPVITGIGHEVDTSVADEVAWGRHPTPTACAGWVVERVRTYCGRRDAVWEGIVRCGRAAPDRAGGGVGRIAQRVAGATGHHLRGASQRVDAASHRLAHRPPLLLERAGSALEQRALRLASVDPQRALARGWSVTRTADGRLVRAPADAPAGTRLVTTTAGGDVLSTVDES